MVNMTYSNDKNTESHPERWDFVLQKTCFCHWKHPFWGFFRVFLQDFYKMQNLILLNISILQSKFCIFVFLRFTNAKLLSFGN